MREILFRGKRTRDKEWVEGYLVMVTDGQTLNRYPCIVVSYNHDTFDWYEVIPETIGQFTGLLDKNGTKIFEGDYLKWKCSKSGSNKVKEYKVSISWRETGHSYSLTIHHKGEKWGTQKSYWNPNDREVIGNIHENIE